MQAPAPYFLGPGARTSCLCFLGSKGALALGTGAYRYAAGDGASPLLTDLKFCVAAGVGLSCK